jgi:hypothetical protein
MKFPPIGVVPEPSATRFLRFVERLLHCPPIGIWGGEMAMYPYVALRGPTYRENSHANHTWHSPSQQSAYFQAPEAPAVWVRFPSPAPFFLPRPR